MQEGMLFHYLMDESADHYFIPGQLSPDGCIERTMAERSFQAIVSRYDILRTIFRYSGYDRRCSGAVAPQRLPLHMRISGRSIEIRKRGRHGEVPAGRQRAKVQIKRGGADPGERLPDGEEDYEFIWSFHHILMDGWCMGTLVNDFNAFYQGFQSGQQARLPEVRPYSNYITWRNNGIRRVFALLADYLTNYKSLATIPRICPVRQ